MIHEKPRFDEENGYTFVAMVTSDVFLYKTQLLFFAFVHSVVMTVVPSSAHRLSWSLTQHMDSISRLPSRCRTQNLVEHKNFSWMWVLSSELRFIYQTQLSSVFSCTNFFTPEGRVVTLSVLRFGDS